ncbi:outer membrane protein assembly factor BamE [Herbaspirillum sp. WKF16]|uniref:outer membrane protein assembly factor BamE domain-containing protein n=1 Tax=Herbaspirillum sp. WKF16 TaxID=3028312 RepID=UPI0023A99C43|nr:outer membrane protein assembly factor BamE [Herbaspirillum sp. WKF16]WDZ97672.1 outer membrane protein assembly factor BamE [Herbaspirillum sp. WKF16]
MSTAIIRLLRRCAATAGALVAAVAMFGCDRNGNPIEEFGLDKLQKGVSTEADVRGVMGQPDTVWDDGNGARTLEYPKGPEGIRTWMFAIGASGTLIDYRQVLTQEHFDGIRPGMSADQVRRQFGRPRSVAQFTRKNEEVWDWKYRYVHEDRLFNVHFDLATRQVVRTSISEISGR